VVTGKLERDDVSYHLKLYLVQLSPPALLSSAESSVPIASRRFAREVDALVPRLLQGEKEALGTLQVKSEDRDVRIALDGVDEGTLPVTLHPKPGKHRLTATKANHLPLERWVTVTASQETTVELKMTLEPGKLPRDEQPGVEVAHEGRGVWLGRPWPVWVAAGAAVISLGAAGGFALDASQRGKRLEQAYDPVRQVYQAPRTEALRGAQSARLANTFFIVAGVAAVTTAVLTFALPAGGGTTQPRAYVSPLPGQPTVGIQGGF